MTRLERAFRAHGEVLTTLRKELLKFDAQVINMSVSDLVKRAKDVVFILQCAREEENAPKQ